MVNPALPTVKILLVDDQREVRRMLRAALESQFPMAKLQDVPSAEEAMVLLSQEDFNLLVVDVRLAGMSGLEMVEKARRRQPDLSIVVVTGLNDPAIHQQLDQAPIQAWFRKPLPMEDFLAFVSHLLGELPKDLPSPLQTAMPVPADQVDLSIDERLQALCREAGLEGVWLSDEQGALLAQSTSAPPTLQFSNLEQYFSRLSRDVENLQTEYGSEKVPPLLFYLKADHIVSQLRLGKFRVTFWVQREALPEQPYALQMALLQRGQQLLATLSGDRTFLEGRPKAEPSTGEETDQSSIAADASLEALFQNATLELNQPKQVDEFWEQGLSSGEMGDTTHSQMLDFDQARQLGILPSDNHEGAVRG